MKSRRRVSKSGIELIKRFEGFRRSAAKLADGRWTVGYGHVKFAREGVELTERDAEALLTYDLIEVAGAVNDLVFAPLGQNQFDALVSFASNVGVERFKSSSVLRRLNEGDFAKAAFALEIWRRAPFEGEAIVIDALIRRRAAEKALFLTPDDGFVPAPTPVLPPEIDYEAELKPPARAPVTVITPMDGAIAEAYRAPETSLLTAGAPSATTSMADTVTERLRALVPDETAAVATEPPPEPEMAEAPLAPFPAQPETPVEAEPASETPIVEAPVSLPEPPDKQHPLAAKAAGIRHFQRPQGQRKSLLPLLAAASAGVVLFAFAVFWRLNAGADQGDNASDQAVSYIAGILGIICAFYAASMVLDRFAGDED